MDVDSLPTNRLVPPEGPSPTCVYVKESPSPITAPRPLPGTPATANETGETGDGAATARTSRGTVPEFGRLIETPKNVWVCERRNAIPPLPEGPTTFPGSASFLAILRKQSLSPFKSGCFRDLFQHLGLDFRVRLAIRRGDEFFQAPGGSTAGSAHRRRSSQ